MPKEYFAALGVLALICAVGVHLLVKRDNLKHNRPSYPPRIIWDGPVSAGFLLLVAMWFCLVHPGDWHRILPATITIGLWLLGMYFAHRNASTSTKDKDTRWNSR